jgi:hypothetical protein
MNRYFQISSFLDLIDGGVFDLKSTGSHEGVAALNCLTRFNPYLDGQTPIQALKAG